jgi:multidrug resistance efflux pump
MAHKETSESNIDEPKRRSSTDTALQQNEQQSDSQIEQTGAGGEKETDKKSHSKASDTVDEQEPDTVDEEKPDEAAKQVKKGSLVMFLVIFGSMVWYLLADRFSPYTTQARVQGYVVGVSPKVAGLVTDVYVKNNEEVLVGQPLFQIDPSQYEIALSKAASGLEQAQTQVFAGDAGVDSARANLLSAKANELKARQDLRRLTRLHKEDPGTISVRRIEVSQATLEQAQAGVTSSEAAIEQAIQQKGGRNEDNNSILKSAQSSVAKAELDLSNTTVRASTRGVITDLSAESGQYANAGSPIMTLIAVQDVWINAEFTENNLGHLHVGSHVEILFDVFPGEVFKGTIRSIGLGVSTGSTQQPGTLPTVDNSRDWLRQSQRFPVVIGFKVDQHPDMRKQLRVGGQASVMVYVEGHGIMQMFGEMYIRFMSFLSYAY